jgi:hypothetical protein
VAGKKRRGSISVEAKVKNGVVTVRQYLMIWENSHACKDHSWEKISLIAYLSLEFLFK